YVLRHAADVHPGRTPIRGGDHSAADESTGLPGAGAAGIYRVLGSRVHGDRVVVAALTVQVAVEGGRHSERVPCGTPVHAFHHHRQAEVDRVRDHRIEHLWVRARDSCADEAISGARREVAGHTPGRAGVGRAV